MTVPRYSRKDFSDMGDRRKDEARAIIDACGSSWGAVGSGAINAICYILMIERDRTGDGDNPGSDPGRRQPRDAGTTEEPLPSPSGDLAPVVSRAVTDPAAPKEAA